MDDFDKARIRMEHWIHHNEHHQEEYELFADQLEDAGKKETARHIREMIEYTAKTNEALRKALASLV
ncbi:hypothetical protein [Desulfatiglans anilini]|uniref:hypothetical protein n=1 Tax=Desulfatiglans anilini TaxID=90728 RepID=UPI0003F6C418|nr:hypothetical protein [Desulfatiglans anilini]